MVRRVEAVTGEIREVDAADERDLVVDHDRLLMVAVHRPLVAIERTLDPRRDTQPLASRAHLGASRVKQRHGRSGPQQHANVDRLGELGQQPTEHDRRVTVAHELQRRLQMPAGDVDVRTSGGEPLGDTRERRRSIDEHLDAIARPRRRVACRPATRRRIQRPLPTVTAKTAPMMRADQSLHAVTHALDDCHPFTSSPRFRALTYPESRHPKQRAVKHRALAPRPTRP